MPSAPTFPGVYVQEVSRGVRTIAGLVPRLQPLLAQQSVVR